MIWTLKFIGVAISVMLTDVCWAKYIIYSSKKDALKAAIWSGAIVVCGSFSFFGYLEDKRFVFASIIGAFIGTYLTVKRSDPEDEEELPEIVEETIGESEVAKPCS